MAEPWHPTRNQALLLKAILASGDEQVSAWRHWASQTVLEDIDTGSILLLPLLYQRLRDSGLREPVMDRYRAVNRHWMLRNTRTRQRIDGITQGLLAAGVELVVIRGGAALVGGLYPSPATRPIGATSLLISAADRGHALNLMRDRTDGGAAKTPMAAVWRGTSIARGAVRVPGSQGDRIEIRWASEDTPERSETLRDLSIPFDTAAPNIRRLTPEVRLVDDCARAVGFGQNPGLFWIVDTLRSLEQEPVDWNAVVTEAQRRHRAARVACGLNYLARTWGARIPNEVAVALDRTPKSRDDRAFLRGQAPATNARALRALHRVRRAIAYEYRSRVSR